MGLPFSESEAQNNEGLTFTQVALVLALPDAITQMANEENKMANPLDEMQRKLDQTQAELAESVREMESLMAAFDCDPVLDVELFSFTDEVNAKREALGLAPVSRVTYALTESIENALKLTETDYVESR